MKKTLMLFAAVLFFTSAIPIHANAAARQGATCPTLGKSEVVSGKRFTCMKSGKKLVWNKGSAATKPSSTATQSQTSAEIIDTKWYPWNFRINGAGTLERKGGPLTTWSSAAGRKGQIIDPIRVKAFEEFRKYSIIAEDKPGIVNFAFGPNVTSDAESAYRAYFNSSIKFFESRIPAGTVLNVLVVSEKDDDFAKATLVKFLGNQDQATEVFKRSEPFIRQFDSLGKRSSGGGGVGSFGAGKPLLYFGYVCSCFNAEDLLMYNVAHEVTHYFQFATTPNVRKQNFIGNFPNWVEGKIYIPNALIEGSANTLGSAILVQHVGWYSDMMDWHLGRYKRDGKIKSIASTEEAVKLINATKSYNLDPTGLGDLNYALGQLVWEYYIATYGVDSYLTLFENIEKFGDFEEAILKTEKITELEFYQNVAPYAMRAFNSVAP